MPDDMREAITASAAISPIWPENEESFLVFVAMQTQWRVSMGGPTGLDYAAVPVVMDMQAVPADNRRQVFEDLRVMETEALKVFADGRK